MKFLLILTLSIFSREVLTAGLGRLFGFNQQNAALGSGSNFFSFLTPVSDYEDIQEDPTLPTLPSFPPSLLFVEPNPIPTNLQTTAAGRNANINGEGRVFGALFALQALRNQGFTRGGIIINTPLNLTNVNNNTVVPTAGTITTGTAAAAGGRIVPFPVPSGGYYDRRSQDMESNVPGQQVRLPGNVIRRRRPIMRKFKNPYAAYNRVQYLKK